jgi:RNA polymerase sigma-70 factor (ECF subfamily)
MDRFRRQAVRRETALECAYDRADRRIPCEDGAAELSELQSAVVSALLDMPPRDRALVVMREMQGMTYQEMAHVLELSVNTLKPALHRARQRLRLQLAKAGVRP